MEDTQIAACLKCSPFAECYGGDVIEVEEGYWRESDQVDIIVSCENCPDNCLGGKNNSTCSEGHTGPLCETCDITNGFTRTGSYLCANCGDILNNTLKVIGLITLYVNI